MSDRFLATPVALATVLVAGLLTPVTVAGQTRAGEAKTSVPPRTADGRPDLQGIWSYATVTPLERPSELAGKEFLTEEEAAAFEAEQVLDRNADLNRDELIGAVTDRGVVNGTTETRDLALAYNDFWWDRGTTVVGTRRTSLVIDPPDGRIPALTASAQARAAARVKRSERPTEGPEDRSLSERCILRGNAGPPMTPAGYNNNFHLLQTPGHVVIFNEQIHDARVVPMDQRRHLSRASGSGWAIRAAGGRAIHWWSKPRTSPTRRLSEVAVRGCISSSALLSWTLRPWRTSSPSTIRSRSRHHGRLRFQ